MILFLESQENSVWKRTPLTKMFSSLIHTSPSCYYATRRWGLDCPPCTPMRYLAKIGPGSVDPLFATPTHVLYFAFWIEAEADSSKELAIAPCLFRKKVPSGPPTGSHWASYWTTRKLSRKLCVRTYRDSYA